MPSSLSASTLESHYHEGRRPEETQAKQNRELIVVLIFTSLKHQN
jgi:hypothetical protein